MANISDDYVRDGDCFQISANIVLQMTLDSHAEDAWVVLREGHASNVRLVHANVRHPHGFRHTHAFIRCDFNITLNGQNIPMDMVLDYANGKEYTLPAAFYYNVGDIRPEDPDEYREYSRDEAMHLLLEHEHYGGWHIHGEREAAPNLETTP